jgi:hypothetical protein
MDTQRDCFGTNLPDRRPPPRRAGGGVTSHVHNIEIANPRQGFPQFLDADEFFTFSFGVTPLHLRVAMVSRPRDKWYLARP